MNTLKMETQKGVAFRMGAIQFNTELSREWMKSLASEILRDSNTCVLETEMASRVLLYIKLDGNKWHNAEACATMVLEGSEISDKGKILALSIITLAEMNR